MTTETETQTRLRRSKESLTALQSLENEARKALADAVDSTGRAREKHDELFLASEQKEYARKKAAYDHCTK